MNRRSFLAAAGLTLLAGCGGSGSDGTTGFAGPGNNLSEGTAAQQVSGRIAPELLFNGSQIGSAYGPTTVTGNTFTTAISADTVGLLALEDSSGGVRAFTLTLPGESPVLSPENTALAIVFMEPGFLRLDPGEARELISRIQASPAFAPLVQILVSNAQTRPLDLLSGDLDFTLARDALVQSLGNPFTAAEPTGTVQTKERGTIHNPSPRFLRVVSDDSPVARLIPPYGSLSDVSTNANYTFHGLGPASTLPSDTSLIESTYFPTLIFAVILPWLELAIGRKIPVEYGLSITQTLQAQPLEPRVDLANTTSLSTAIAVDLSNLDLGGLSEAITAAFISIFKLIIGSAHVAGIAFAINAVIKFKDHKNNPTQNPSTLPISLLFLGAILLYLDAIKDNRGADLFAEQK